MSHLNLKIAGTLVAASAAAALASQPADAACSDGSNCKPPVTKPDPKPNPTPTPPTSVNIDNKPVVTLKPIVTATGGDGGKGGAGGHGGTGIGGQSDANAQSYNDMSLQQNFRYEDVRQAPHMNTIVTGECPQQGGASIAFDGFAGGFGLGGQGRLCLGINAARELVRIGKSSGDEGVAAAGLRALGFLIDEVDQSLKIVTENLYKDCSYDAGKQSAVFLAALDMDCSRVPAWREPAPLVQSQPIEVPKQLMQLSIIVNNAAGKPEEITLVLECDNEQCDIPKDPAKTNDFIPNIK